MRSDGLHVPGASLEGAAGRVEVDADHLAVLLAKLRAQQSFPKGLLAGIVAGVLAALVWAFITRVTGYEVGWIAIGVGFLVAIAVRRFGQGMDLRFSVTGAALALLAVAAGKILAICMFAAAKAEVGALEIFNELSFEQMLALLQASFNPIDLLFYGLALWVGWQFSTRAMTQEELASVLRPSGPSSGIFR